MRVVANRGVCWGTENHAKRLRKTFFIGWIDSQPQG
jgi:hypothetical protein